jgi:hypothetical protein
MPHPKLHLACSGVDALGAVDDKLDALAEQRAVVDRGVVVACDELVTKVMCTSERSRKWLAAVVPAYPPPMTTTFVVAFCSVMPSRHRRPSRCDTA